MKPIKPRAVALYSGGLDSTLAILVMMQHGVEIEAVKFLTHFGCDMGDHSSCGADPYPAAEQFGFNVKLSHLGWKFVDIVRNPKYGHGRNMNPCIDCRLLMLKEARDYMEMTKADFIITGEVLAQRPMSQMRRTMEMISRESDLDGRLVRPLSGRLLPPTKPEIDGLIKREWLLDICGRSRKRQIELARQFGLRSYPTPAGGCLLTDENYSARLRDLFTFGGGIEFTDFNFLKYGRHFRISHKAKLILGRNQKENETILSLAGPEDTILEVIDTGSPVGILRGRIEPPEIEKAARIIVRYSDAKHAESATIRIRNGNMSRQLNTTAADDDLIAQCKIGK